MKVFSNTDFPELRFAAGAELLLELADGQERQSVTVERSRPHKKVYLVKFIGHDKIEDVSHFRDAKLVVPISEAALDQLDENEFYYYQIIGCTVLTTDGTRIGKVKEIIQSPANDVWVISPDQPGKDILVPFVKQFVKEVDVQAQQITIEWMEGLGSS